MNPPTHIAMIMDGNGRWARERGLSRSEGHRAGAEAVRRVVESCDELGVKFLTLYAFSSENWKRPKSEIDALMVLLEQFLAEKTPEICDRNVRLQAIGRLQDLPVECRDALDKAIATTAENTGLTLVLALSYGAREEIIDACRSIAQSAKDGSLSPDDIDTELVSSRLYTSDFPDPDLLVRTSGELRLSNFLLWQISYAEIFVTKKYWPDFGRDDLAEAINNYNNRQRRFGGLT